MKLTDAQRRALREVERQTWRFDGHFYPIASAKARRDVIQRLVNARLCCVGPRVHSASPACALKLSPAGHAALQEERSR